MNDQVIKNPNYKTGVKILTREQMQAGLPTYDLLLTKIEKIRSESLCVDRISLNSQTFDNLKYDNIFSILGGRGAGKTSVLMTLHHELQEDKRNVILPLVMPELLDEEESIVGWLLSAMEYNLEQIEAKIDEHGIKNVSNSYRQFCENNRLFERCVFSKNNALRERFHQLKTAYYTKEYKSCNMTTMDYTSVKELIASGVDNSFSLIKKFTDYWNTLVDVYAEYLMEILGVKDKKDIDSAPLIHIFIDDADLKPQIINELLFVIPKYLSHPNVVVYVSASQKTLTYAVKNHMYKSLTQTAFNLPDIMEREYQYNSDCLANGNETTTKFHDLRYGKEYAKITKLADEVLRKIFPVYKRFYLKKYCYYSEKRLLRVFKDESPDCKETMQLSDKVAEMLGEFRDGILQLHGGPKTEPVEPTRLTWSKKTENFKLVEDKKIDDRFQLGSEMYLSFLGQYPRDMMSVLYSLRDMLKSMTELLEDYYKGNNIPLGAMPLDFIDSMHEIIIKFISAAVSSNQNLSMFSRPIRDFVKTQLLHWQLYVDYAKVLEIFNDERYVKGNKQDCSPFVEMICLLNFVEQLIILVMPQRRTPHGDKELNSLLRLCEIEVVKPVKDIDLLFKQYYLFESMHLIPKFNIGREEQRESFLKGIVELKFEKQFSDRKDAIKYREWYELVSHVLFWSYSLAAQIPQYADDLLIIRPIDFLDQYYDEVRVDYRVRLNRNFYLEEEPKTVKDAAKVIGGMDKAIDTLEEALEHLKLKYIGQETFANDEERARQTTLIQIADMVHDNQLVRRLAEMFVSKFANGEPVLRANFLSELQQIEAIVENTSRNRLSLKRWVQSFKAKLRQQFSLVNDDESYGMYVKACGIVKELYEEYIDYYTWVIKQDNGKISKNPVYSAERSRLLNVIISEAKEYEWTKIVGTE